MQRDNLFANIPSILNSEIFETLAETRDLKIERILSSGQATPAGQWYDQEWHEWVVLLKGRAGLLFEDSHEIFDLKPGDYLNIPAGRRHRVEWTDSQQQTVWLAIHYK